MACPYQGRRPRPVLSAFVATMTATMAIVATAAAQGTATTATTFQIPKSLLADALDRFSEQSGLQVVYDDSLRPSLIAPGAQGTMPAGEALDRLLAGSGLQWTLINSQTIAIRPAVSRAPLQVPHQDAPSSSFDYVPLPRTVDGSVVLSELHVVEDPNRVLPSEVSGSSFGFAKSLLDTPRSVSFISEETINRFGIAAVEDLMRVVPGTYTPTRFGIQGGIDVRSVPADTFFRGMKRFNLQGHAPTVLSAMDSIEVVRGPPSPIYGMGKIGGYTNMVPRSGRAADGSYLEQSVGDVRAAVASYDRSELSVNLRGPLQAFGRHGGYDAFVMNIESDSYARGVPADARLAQGAVSLERIAGGFRLESGVSVQSSRSAGALLGRFTQDLADNGRYIRGTPLVNLDLNGNGRIGYREYNTASPVRGTLSTYNQPLVQRWDWPTDADGVPLPLDQFPVVPGIPESMYQYLSEHPEADPTGLLRAQGVGGPRPNGNGYVPVGFVLDPRTVGYDQLDLRRFTAFERELKAEMLTAFIDLIDDRDPDFTIKNQLFLDTMDQYKISEQPFGTAQQPRVIEDKFTLTRRLRDLPSWLRVNTLASVNARFTLSPTQQCFGDFSTHRSDAMASTWTTKSVGMTPNTTFANCLENSNVDDDGFPFTNDGQTRYSELGAGVLFDIELWERTQLLVGGRHDGSEARNVEYAGTYNFNTGTAANPGAKVTQTTRVRGWDTGPSWTLSLSYQLPWNLRPYITVSEASLTLDNNANRLTAAVIEAGHIGQSRLTEVGIKASLLDRRLFFSSALYQQRRINVSDPDDPTITAEASSTLTEGWETEIKWVPIRGFFASFYALTQKTLYSPNRGGSILIDARSLGFQDVVDPATGEVIYPAEAFLFGGRAFVQLPAGVDAYREKQGNPNTQLGATLNAQTRSGFGFTLSANYFSSVPAGRLQLIELPSATVLNTGVFYDDKRWHLQFDVFNANNERYFRARNGDTLADLPVSAMPARRWQATITRRF
ncbi:TonB-dependent Receptor Plug Domain [Hydrocarboniphaga daqingensis]|uniref:TonB-dependent Receptor Plug Domain n=2 Tax=Hydrocarboniphaga daqingensis TaxID=490188 RepID=A0A1M5NYL0_9GAMM|nr:TonB-dependent Receptor Plug Domain [Hydrocarboniphaga daqingensis]